MNEISREISEESKTWKHKDLSRKENNDKPIKLQIIPTIVISLRENDEVIKKYNWIQESKEEIIKGKSNLQKERLTNDVRYQDSSELTLDEWL